MIVLSVDVGLQVCGYALARVQNQDIALIKEGEIKPDQKQSLPQKLDQIYEALQQEITAHTAQAVIVETLYSHHRHPTTLGVLAQVRGVVALLAHKNGIDFFEYAPTRARKAFLGQGASDSGRVKKMAENLTGRQFRSVHAADAFSLIPAYAHEQKFKKILEESRKI